MLETRIGSAFEAVGYYGQESWPGVAPQAPP